MSCKPLAENTGRKKSPKIRHLRTITQLCQAASLRLRHLSTIAKKMLNSNISSTCSHNTVNFSQLAAEIGLSVAGTPTNFNGFRVLASLLHRRRSTDVNQTLHDVWRSPELVDYIYTFGGCCPLKEFYQVQNSRCVQVLRSLILAALLHGTPAAGVSQTLRRGTRNGITQLSQTVPPIFGWAAITLGIGPHYSCFYGLP